MGGYFEVIAEEWRARAAELGQWAFARMVNRTDVWGAYLPRSRRRQGADGREQKVVTAPFSKARGKEFLTKGVLTRHFAGLDVGHVTGLHATSADGTSRWLGIDVDLHDDDDPALAGANRASGIDWHDRLVERGFDPILFDSNGAGGFHLLLVFAEPVPSADAHALGLALTADWERRGLARAPELFPRQAKLDEGDYGSWLRLPGRHHTREFWSRAWSGEPGQDGWIEGSAAVERILQTVPAPPSLVPPAPPAPAPKKPKRLRAPRPRVCVDLDGVLAAYAGWQGLEFMGAPLPGAVEFTRRLSQVADVLIFTTRCTVEPHRAELGEPSRPASDLAPRLLHRVKYWLDQHGFSYAEVWSGQGKPLASAYIDDRAVACRPQEDPRAFAEALARVRVLCGERSAKAPKSKAGAEPGLESRARKDVAE